MVSSWLCMPPPIIFFPVSFFEFFSIYILPSARASPCSSRRPPGTPPPPFSLPRRAHRRGVGARSSEAKAGGEVAHALETRCVGGAARLILSGWERCFRWWMGLPIDRTLYS
jgi:hypothetical protein